MRGINKEKLAHLSPTQQKLYLEKLEALAKYKKENPLYFYNHPKIGSIPPHKKQLVFHSLKIRTKAFFGGNQSGKTTAGIADDLIQLCDREVIPKHLLSYKKWEPPFYLRVFTPDLGPTMIGVQQKMQELLPHSQLIGNSWDKAYDKVNRVTRFKNGSWVMWNSYDQEQLKLGTVTLHRVHYDEEPTRKVFEESQPRLLRYNGDQIITMTPTQGLTWTYREIWEACGGIDDDDQFVFINKDIKTACVVVDMDDNPTLSTEAKEDTLRGYSQEMRRARKEGRFVHFAGLIYNEFNESVHVKRSVENKPFKNKNVTIVVGIDPGIRYACSVLWAAIDQEGVTTVFEEIYAKDWTIKDVCERINQVNAYHEIEPAYYVIDPHAKDRSKQTGRSDMSEFQRHGIFPLAGQTDVEPGINAVKEKLRDHTLYIHGSCRNLINEFRLYRWKDAPNSEEEIRPVPIKQDDHALDALRYIIMSRPYLPKEAVLDLRSPLQIIMDDDKEKTATQPTSEFGGVFY